MPQSRGRAARGSALFALFSTGVLFALPASAAPFFDDFEDGNLDGWAPSNTGGTATFDVVDRNASNRAHVGHLSHTSTGDESALSITFAYAATDQVSFEMEAVAFLASSIGITVHGLAGVRLSFLDGLDVPLGSAGLFNATSASLLGPNDSAIGITQQSFSATMAEWAAQAGLGDVDPIAAMRLSFLAQGDFFFGAEIYPDARSGGDVWFDNVAVVPEPDTLALVSLGLSAMCAIARRGRLPIA